MPSVVDELLRYEPPVQLAARVAVEPHEIADRRVSPGDQVFVSIAAANRDADRFPEPDRFLPARDARGHLAFGGGAHFCAGAALARTEAVEILSRLVALDSPIEDRSLVFTRRPSATFRRLASLTLGP